jgi:hypothetical protein
MRSMSSDLGKYWSTRDMLRQPGSRESSRHATALLRVLFDKGRMPVPELLTRSGLDFDVFSAALSQLVEAGFVVVGDENGRQVAAPSDEGAELKT